MFVTNRFSNSSFKGKFFCSEHRPKFCCCSKRRGNRSEARRCLCRRQRVRDDYFRSSNENPHNARQLINENAKFIYCFRLLRCCAWFWIQQILNRRFDFDLRPTRDGLSLSLLKISIQQSMKHFNSLSKVKVIFCSALSSKIAFRTTRFDRMSLGVRFSIKLMYRVSLKKPTRKTMMIS